MKHVSPNVASLAVAALIAVSFVHSSLAQSSLGGAWLSAGLGAAQAGPANTGAHDRHGGFGATLGAGLVISDRLLAGLQGTHWSRALDEGTSHVNFLTLALQGYPIPFAPLDNLYLLAGAGVGASSFPTRVVTFDSSRLSVTRFALQFGAGYDIPVACPLWATAFVQILNTVGGAQNPRIKPGEGTDNAVLLHAGFALTFYHFQSSSRCSGRAGG